ncbi:MAG: hypothetical protein IT292_04990 [Deltaproteobacteria bacterium]|nr:hypothetical protein [Deltaproteobacteria bacterium]
MLYYKLDVNGDEETGFKVGRIEQLETQEANDLMTYCEETRLGNLSANISIEKIGDPGDYLSHFKDAKLYKDLTGYHFFLKSSEDTPFSEKVEKETEE